MMSTRNLRAKILSLLPSTAESRAPLTSESLSSTLAQLKTVRDKIQDTNIPENSENGKDGGEA